MEFPESEADILALALRMAAEMERDPDRFRDAPVSAAELRASVEKVKAAIATAGEAEARSCEAHAARDKALEDAKEHLGAHLWYTEMDVAGEPERLSGLGWGGRPGATDREPPGEVRDLTAQRHGDASVWLQWRPPADGGPAAEYRVQRRKPGGPWRYVATAVDNDTVLSDQPCGIEFDLRVVAVNRTGVGRPSPSVTVVL